MPIKKRKSKAPRKRVASSRDTDSTWDDELLTTRELMSFLNLSRTKIWEYVQREELPAFKIGGDYRYRRSEVLEWLERFRVDNRKKP